MHIPIQMTSKLASGRNQPHVECVSDAVPPLSHTCLQGMLNSIMF